MNIIPVTTIGAVDTICAVFSIVPNTSFSIGTQSRLWHVWKRT